MMTTEERPATRLSMADLAQHVREEAPAPKSKPATPKPSTPKPSESSFRRGTQAAESSEQPVSRPSKPASAASVKYLRELVAERYPSASEQYVASVIAQGQSRVSQAIGKLKAMPKVADVPRKPAPRPNKFPGNCENCGQRVAAEEGTVALADNGKWEVEHLEGECPVSEFPFPLGRYAVVLDGETHFFHAMLGGLFEQAGDTLYPVKGKRSEEVVRLVSENPEAASRLYGQEIGTCGRCGRALTDEVSRAAGIGPVCAKKGWS